MKDTLQRLVQLIGSEENPHLLIAEVAADGKLFQLVQQLCREKELLSGHQAAELIQRCRINHVPFEYFRDRLELIGRILNLSKQEQNYYSILGVERTATHQDIKHAFRRLSLAHHPDTNPDDPEAAEQFRNILHAYEILSNEELREHYDRSTNGPVWLDDAADGEPEKRPTSGKKWIYLWPAAALLAALIALIFSVDFQNLMTDKYYQNRRTIGATHQSSLQETREGAAPGRPMPDVAAYGEKLQKMPVYYGRAVKDGGLVSTTDPKKGAKRVYAKLAVTEAVELPPQPSSPPSAEKKDPPKQVEAPGQREDRPTTIQSGKEKPPAASSSNGQTANKEDSVAQRAKPNPSEALPAEQKESSSPDQTGKHAAPADKSAQVSIPTKEKETPRLPSKATAKQPEASPVPQKTKDAPEKSTLASAAKPDTSSKPVESTRAAGKSESFEEMQDRVQEFLQLYAKTYQQKNEKGLKKLFESNALEKDQAVRKVISEYRNTSRSADWIRLSIHMRKCWQTADAIGVKASFRLGVQPAGKKPMEAIGPMTFMLVDNAGKLKIRDLEYAPQFPSEAPPAQPQKQKEIAAVPSPQQKLAVRAPAEPQVDSHEQLRKRIQEFLAGYTQAYQQKNERRFFSYFQPGATENGKPVQSLVSTYRRTFNSADRIRFQIQLQSCQAKGNEVSVKGVFHIEMESSGQEPRRSSGLIHLQLLDLGSNFKVRYMEYSVATNKS